MPFDAGSLESEELTKLFNEVSSHVQTIRIEMVPCRESHRIREEHPAATIGLNAWSPTSLFTEHGRTNRGNPHRILVGLRRSTSDWGHKHAGGILVEPDFEKLSFEKAVQLFKGWGFLVEQGPGHAEVTLILEGPNHRSYYVCETEKLPEMAKSVLRMRWCTGAMMAPGLDV